MKTILRVPPYILTREGPGWTVHYIRPSGAVTELSFVLTTRTWKELLKITYTDGNSIPNKSWEKEPWIIFCQRLHALDRQLLLPILD